MLGLQYSLTLAGRLYITRAYRIHYITIHSHDGNTYLVRNKLDGVGGRVYFLKSDVTSCE